VNWAKPERILAVLVAAAAAAAGLWGRSALDIETYQNPRALVAGDRLHLFARAGKREESVCLREGDGRWQRLGELIAKYSTVAHADGKFYLFLKDIVIELEMSGDTRRKSARLRWPYNWRAQSAEVIGGVLTAFGVGSGKLYMARKSPALPGPPATTTGPVPATSPPAGAASGRQLPFSAGRWPEEPVAVKGEGSCKQVRTLLVGDALWLFWSAEGEGGHTHTLWAGRLAGKGVAAAREIATWRGSIRFAPALLDGKPTIIYARLPGRLAGDCSLLYQQYDKGEWQPFKSAGNVRNPLLERTRELDAATLKGKVHLFLGTRFRVLRTVYHGGLWTPPETVLADPQADWIIRHSMAILYSLAFGLGLLVASLFRARLLPHRVEIAGIKYRLASWPERMAAYACDLMISVAAVWVMHWLAGQPPGAHRTMVAVFCFELFYFAVSEARSGKTIGKRLCGLIVVSRNGGYPSWSEALLRNVLRALLDSLVVVLLFFPLLGWLAGSVILLNTRGSQRAGDLAAGTYVVRERGKR